MSDLSDKSGLPLADLTVEVAKSLLGTPYVGGTLEGGSETFRVNLSETDCILFVEMVISFALTIKGFNLEINSIVSPSYSLLCDNIRCMRYRGGVVDGYASRLHYTSEWIAQGERNGVMCELSSVLGERLDQSFSFMTSHKDLYPLITSDAVQLKKIGEVEAMLEERGSYYFISQSLLRQPSVINYVKSGDIVAFVSKTEGLDITHVGIACLVGDEMHFIHASSKAGRVIVEPKSLADYASNGLRLVRLRNDYCNKNN